VARPPTTGLTDAELRIMRALWDLKRGTVGEVLEHLDDRPAYNTVLTILGILERKGYVTHEKAGRAHVYLPLVEQRDARRSALAHILHRFFDNSPELLVLDLLGPETVDPSELQSIRELLELPRAESGAKTARRRRR
jgi:BlaI family penicillinase repressor